MSDNKKNPVRDSAVTLVKVPQGGTALSYTLIREYSLVERPSNRTNRGGGVSDSARALRVAYQGWGVSPALRDITDLGFRIVRNSLKDKK